MKHKDLLAMIITISSTRATAKPQYCGYGSCPYVSTVTVTVTAIGSNYCSAVETSSGAGQLTSTESTSASLMTSSEYSAASSQEAQTSTICLTPTIGTTSSTSIQISLTGGTSTSSPLVYSSVSPPITTELTSGAATTSWSSPSSTLLSAGTESSLAATSSYVVSPYSSLVAQLSSSEVSSAATTTSYIVPPYSASAKPFSTSEVSGAASTTNPSVTPYYSPVVPTSGEQSSTGAAVSASNPLYSTQVSASSSVPIYLSYGAPPPQYSQPTGYETNLPMTLKRVHKGSGSSQHKNGGYNSGSSAFDKNGSMGLEGHGHSS